MAIVVRFSDSREFIDELTREPAAVVASIVRVTKLFRTSRQGPTLRHLSIVATARVRDEILRFERYCGDLWGEGFEQNDQKPRACAETLQGEIEAACQALGLDVRAGVIEAAEEGS